LAGTQRALLVVICAVLLACARFKRSSDESSPPSSAPSAVAIASVAASSAPSAAASSGPPDATPEKLEGFVRMTVRGVAPTQQGSAVLLVDEEKRRAVPIFVGETEALSIRMRLDKRRYTRPLTHDLMDSALDKLGARVEFVRVDKLEDGVFIGTVVLRDGTRRIELDARSSDAVALALGRQVPIFVAKQVIDVSGVDLDHMPEPKPDESDRRPDPVAL
jgi:uncharacterized protein